MEDVCGSGAKDLKRGDLVEREHLVDLGVDERVILKWTFKKRVRVSGFDFGLGGTGGEQL
jgi:hypothetical protein